MFKGYRRTSWRQHSLIFKGYLLPSWGQHSLIFKGYRRPFSPDKRPGREAGRSRPCSTDIKNEWSYNPTPPICLHGVGRGNFTVTLPISVCYALWPKQRPSCVNVCIGVLHFHWRMFPQCLNEYALRIAKAATGTVLIRTNVIVSYLFSTNFYWPNGISYKSTPTLMMKLWTYSQHNKCFWNRYNTAWPFRGEPISDHVVPTAATYSVRELS